MRCSAAHGAAGTAAQTKGRVACQSAVTHQSLSVPCVPPPSPNRWARRAWATYGYKSFLLYCAGDLKLKSKTYINDCMHIARLDPLRFDGCILNMDALICAARHLGETAQRALAEAARDPIRSGTFITSAVEKVYKLDDAAAAMYLRAWLIEGKEMVFSTEEPSGEPPPPPSATSLCRAMSALLQEEQRVLLQIEEALDQGDRPTPRVAFELRALLKDQPRCHTRLAELVPQPRLGRPRKGERRQQGRPPQTPPAPAPAAPPPAPPPAPAAVAGPNAFNPAMSLILSGLYTRTSQDPARYAIGGFRQAPGAELGPGTRGFSLAESELGFAASIDPWWQGAANIALHAVDSVSVEEAYVQTTALGHGLGVGVGDNATVPLLDEHDYALEEDDETEENPWLNLGCCLLAMMKDLPDKYRQALELADLKEVKHKEIATMIGLSESAVKSRVKRGREKLRDMLVSCCGEDCRCHEQTTEQGCCHQ